MGQSAYAKASADKKRATHIYVGWPSPLRVSGNLWDEAEP